MARFGKAWAPMAQQFLYHPSVTGLPHVLPLYSPDDVRSSRVRLAIPEPTHLERRRARAIDRLGYCINLHGVTVASRGERRGLVLLATSNGPTSGRRWPGVTGAREDRARRGARGGGRKRPVAHTLHEVGGLTRVRVSPSSQPAQRYAASPSSPNRPAVAFIGRHRPARAGPQQLQRHGATDAALPRWLRGPRRRPCRP